MSCESAAHMTVVLCATKPSDLLVAVGMHKARLSCPVPAIREAGSFDVFDIGSVAL